MKKTLIISLEYSPSIGGVATYVSQLAASLPPELIVVLAPPLPKHQQEASPAPLHRVIRESLYFPKFLWPRWLKLFFVVKKLVKQERIEIIHVHHVLPVGYVAYLIKKIYGIPYIIFSHGTDIAFAAKTKRKRTLLVRVARASLQVITNSMNLRERLLAQFPQLEAKTTVMYPCPDPQYLTPPQESDILALKQRYALHGKKVLLTVSRFVEGKGFPHLLRVMPDILKQVPHLVWCIIGEGEPQKQKEIIDSIQKNNLQNIVRFIGSVPHRELKTYYYLADVFVLLTHPDNGLEEGLGLVFLEAATAGLPVVAGKSGGVEEAVLHEKTGLVVDVLNHPEDIVTSIVRLLQDPVLAKQLGTAAQTRIKQEFQFDTQLSRITPFV